MTPAGSHAIRQILLRFQYMRCEGRTCDIAEKLDCLESDLVLDQELYEIALKVEVEKRRAGAYPLLDR